MEVFRSVLSKYRAIVERRSQSFVSHMRPGLGLNQKEAYQNVIRRIDQLWEELEREMSLEMAEKNAKIDSPQSYAKLFRQCRKW